MDAAQVPVMWEEIISKATSRGARAAAEAMAEEMQKLARGLVSHPGRAGEGQPPGFQSGHLREMIRRTPVRGSGNEAVAGVGSFAVYAAVQEFGADLWPSHKKYLHWVDAEGRAYHKIVHVREHPYMRRARETGIRTGAFSRAGWKAFVATIGLG